MSVKKRNLDQYLGEIFKQFIAIKDEDYKKSQEVFKCVFEEVRAKMRDQCNFFGKYHSQVMYAGSVYDGIKVSKLNEFDMDIVIRLPINYEDIMIENDQAGFVRLKIETAFDHLDKQKDWEKCHVVTRDWRDSDKYFLQNKFRNWVHSIVKKAINDLNEHVTVNGVTYLVTFKQSGPAYTLLIENDRGNEPFKLDVDLVPVIRFMYPRWLDGYRTVEDTQVKEWLVVPKPPSVDQYRCWRLSFQEFEREMMKGCQQLKTTIRLVKKLRDALQMKDIASYYIKTLFLWKIDETKDKKYWQKGLSVLFREMIQVLHDAIKEKNIKYFWHADNNLIEKMKPTIQRIYVDKLKDVLDAIDNNEVDKVASYLLTVNELHEFKISEFYQKQMEIYQRHLANSCCFSVTSQISRQESVISVNNNSNTEPQRDARDSQDQDASLIDLVRALTDKVTAIADDQQRLKKIEADAKGSVTRTNAVADLLKEINRKIDEQNMRLKKLEDALKEERNQLNNKIEMLMDKIDSQNERLKLWELGNKNCKEKFLNDGDSLADALEIEHNQIRLTKIPKKEDKRSQGEELFGKSSTETLGLQM